ncbi:DUF924 family protein [Caulobacter sp. RL271]|jgi:uncharacterized protein (DUF924 family)|uniref:DUF924 family protein n=1 Tax=Caulobacter segnis TaxID=88688 RepID=A0ABY4ZXR6_9CAUL|nr:DUF924 family protein [Caulobacter segnis]USQ97637.1 DUF924 family protein [Caulobacter segnis]
MRAHPNDVVHFWRQAGPRKWFAKDQAFDSAIALKFEQTHYRASMRRYDGWAETAEGALALLILLDQFPRNMYRDTPHAFATDPLARMFAHEAIAAGHDQDPSIEADLRRFFYLPFEHSESLVDQEFSVQLFAALQADTGDEESMKYALIHRDIIARFGRFPHRNAGLGRKTTDAEREFLDEGGFAG